MKRLLSLIGLILSTISCKKEKHLSPYEYQMALSSGKVTATLNGNAWQSDVCLPMYYRGAKSDTVNITAKIFGNKYEKQNLTINLINLKSNSQKIETLIRYDSISARYSLAEPGQKPYSTFLAMNDNIVENTYLLYEDSQINNYVTIEEYNPATKMVKGNFEANYVRYWLERGNPLTQDMKDTIHFTDGKFEFYLK